MKRTGMTAKFWASAEFQARQFCLEFGRVARTVVSVISKMHKELRKWEKPKNKLNEVVTRLGQLELWFLCRCGSDRA